MPRFSSFVILADMRTGSNFLEANLNALDGVRCLGEVFNPHFIGYPDRAQVLGTDKAARDAAPLDLLARIRAQDDLCGFRLFHDHDPRALAACLQDRSCAKIVLTRNPADSYVSLKIARATGQWKLTDPSRARRVQANFDRGEFLQHLSDSQAYQLHILKALQHGGQCAFYIDYDDLQDLDTLNGLAAWLGVAARLEALDDGLKRQNPAAAEDKVQNFDQMAAALADLDGFNLTRTPNFEPRRGPVAPSYMTAARSGLLFQPLRGGPEMAVRSWLAALDGAPPEEGHTQNSLRRWQRAHPGHRAFTVLRHPLARIHATFCDRILPHEGDAYLRLRATLRAHHDVPLPAGAPGPGYDHGAAFGAFLRFVAQNLGGHTAVRVDPAWASAASVIAGFADLRSPDALIREDEMAQALPALAARAGHADAPPPPAPGDPHAQALAAIHDSTLEKLCRKAYARDYEIFGWGDWRDQAA